MRSSSIATKGYSEHNLGGAFACLPLRTGCYIIGVLYLSHSLLALFGFFSEDTRLTVGGFTWSGRMVIGAVGFVGIFCAFLGLVGLNDNNPIWVRNFCYYMIVRTICIIGVFVADTYALQGCEDMIKNGQFFDNYVVQSISVAGKCKNTKKAYTICFVIDLLLSIYGIFVLRRFCNITETCPTYLIHLDETRPLRTYTTPVSVRTQPAQTASPQPQVTPGLVQSMPARPMRAASPQLQATPAAMLPAEPQITQTPPQMGQTPPHFDWASTVARQRPPVLGESYAAFPTGGALPPVDTRQ